MPLDVPAFHALTTRQSGVVARRQLAGELGGRDHDVARLVRRRDLTPVHPGVFVDHTGPLTWEQRAWAAVLAAWPAALSHESAMPESISRRDGPVHVAVDRKRTVRALPGVRIHRMSHVDDRVDWNRSPPRVRIADAVIDVCAARVDTPARFQVLAEACRTRMTTPTHLTAALSGRERVADRALIQAMIVDLASGASSVLEREYLTLERRHGLPRADRQRSDILPSGPVYRDVPYPAYGVVVELDGRANHDSRLDRDRDLERDLDTRVADDTTTVRLGYRQVFGRGCATVAKIAVLLRRRGWTGHLAPCPRCA